MSTVWKLIKITGAITPFLILFSQLKGKKEKAVSVLKSIHESLVNGRTSDEATKTELMNHLEAQEKKFAGVPCELVGPIQAPSMIGYRVKVELNIGE